MSDTWEYGATEPETETTVAFPWPPPEDGSITTAFGETWKKATFDPASFFSRVPRTHGTGAAVLYYLVIVLIVAGAALFWDSLALFGGGLEETALAGGMDPGSISPIVGFLFTPVILLVMLVVSAGITHALLALFDGARHGFGTTVRVFCYAYSPGVFGVIPLFGGLVGSVWMVVLLIIGLRHAHETEGWKTAVAVLLPVALLVGFMVLALMMVMATGAALLG